MEAAARSGSAGACARRNLSGTFMIKRRARRRSEPCMVFLLDPGRNQVEIRKVGDQFYEYDGAGSSCFLLTRDRKSTRLNSSHSQISYAVFCLKKKRFLTRLRSSCICIT